MTMPREQSTQLPERRILLERAAMVWACAQGIRLLSFMDVPLPCVAARLIGRNQPSETRKTTVVGHLKTILWQP